MSQNTSRALPKFESYAALEKAAFCGPRREAATDQFHGIDGLADRVEGYIALRRSLGYAFHKQAAILRALPRYVAAEELDGPLTRDMALRFRLLVGGDSKWSRYSSWGPPPFLRLSRHLRRANRGARSSRASQIPRYSTAAHIERRGAGIAHVGMPSRFARISRARRGVDDAGWIAGEHGLAIGRGAPP